MQVQVDGLAQFVNRLEKFDKDISKELKKEMRRGAAEVQQAAKSTITGFPLSNWGNWNSNGRDLGYDPSKVRAGFRVKANRHRRGGATTAFGYDVIQSNAGGNIFEVVGDKSRTTGPGGVQFVDAINAKFGQRRPRTLFQAYYKGINAARERMNAAVESAMRKVGM